MGEYCEFGNMVLKFRRDLVMKEGRPKQSVESQSGNFNRRQRKAGPEKPAERDQGEEWKAWSNKAGYVKGKKNEGQRGVRGVLLGYAGGESELGI